jgi:glycosyltransferase involved in cell wall biosynthesis
MTEFAAPADVRPTLIVLSHLRWDFVTQRPQHLMTRAARDMNIIFIEEPLWIDGSAGVETANRGDITIVQPTLTHGTDQASAVDHQRTIVERLVAEARGKVILWFYTPMALAFARDVPADLVVFDKMDELSAFRNAPPLLLALEQELLERADVVFTGGASMHEAAAHRHANIHCFPSSIDTAHFASARLRRLADPLDQALLPRPRLGFFGVIDERFNVALVGELAAMRRDWQLIMIGPVVKIDPAQLPQAPNLHWLGSKTYAELPSYLAGWDIGLMPFAINESTRFISPTKTPEFLAAGLPVVSTAIRDVVQPYGAAGLVEIADTATEFASAIEMLLAREPQEWLDRVDAQLAQGSWDSTEVVNV